MYHYVAFGLIVASLIGSVINLTEAMDGEGSLYSASLITALCVALLFVFFFARVFALKAQDRAIRAEENLRHFAKTGKLLDPALTMRQIIGLRFASDDEYDALAKRAVAEGLTEKQIKQSIKNWRADTYRA
jgi:hypothetical protein